MNTKFWWCVTCGKIDESEIEHIPNSVGEISMDPTKDIRLMSGANAVQAARRMHKGCGMPVEITSA